MKPLRPVILGFGHAGRHLHLRCLRTMVRRAPDLPLSNTIDVVEPNESVDANGHQVVHHRELPSARVLEGQIPVLHVCTPPSAHRQCVELAIAQGYRRIILEKPMAPTLDEARRIRQLAAAASAEVLVVAVWHNSPLTRALFDPAAGAEPSGLALVEIVHNKPRFARSLERDDEHVFDIEMPHQLALAREILGPRATLLSAHAADLVVHGRCKPCMGSGNITMLSPEGVMCRLVSNLHHPGRERCLTLHFHDGRRRIGHYPVSGDDCYSQLFDYSSIGALVRHEIFTDEPLTSCLETYYRHFANTHAAIRRAMPSGASLDFNVDVVSWLDQAKRMASMRHSQENESFALAA
ncbi:MAG TPA: Gfo/Idh/MocA family oxidoreductase [Burkholderiaceae bacterium]|nr:Gfo/Idh/MocA family oxidoreductase [Burkholderiaceae bacterium]